MPDPTKVVVNAVTVSNLLGQSQTFNATWALSGSDVQPDGYVLSIVKDGKSIRNYMSTNSNGDFPIPDTLLSSGNAYQLKIWYRQGNTTGPGSDPVPLIVEAPTNLTATWQK